MSKAVLVMDMPKNCAECNQCQYGNEDGEYSCIPDNFAHYLSSNYVNHSCESKPNWCPLKPMPEEKQHAEEVLEIFINTGYNACIDELLKGEEG